MSDHITISKLRIPIFIGVPEEERAAAQVVELSMELYPVRSFLGTADCITNTVDYYAVTQSVIALAQARPRKLIEQLNEEVLHMLLADYPLEKAVVTTYKFIIPETEYVSLSMTLQRSS